MESDEYKDLIERHAQYEREEAQMELDNNKELICKFTSLCEGKGISLSKDSFSYIQSIGIVAECQNLTLMLTELSVDKEGLVCIKDIKDNFDMSWSKMGYIKGDNFMFFTTRFFRRGFNRNANFAPQFCNMFLSLYDDKIDTYIKLDNDRLRVNVDNRFYMECDTWYGAEFKQSIQDIADGISKLRPTMGLSESLTSWLFADIYTFDIKWTTKDSIKTFIAEEIKNESIFEIIDGVKYYPARYIHSEFDINNNQFRHFDGAIHLYTEEEYYQRRDLDLNFNSKKSKLIKPKSEKLFKMNGEITVDIWQSFTSQFFTGNPLVFEYFEGQYPENIRNIIEAKRNDYD